ncbi:MAG TPA: hypothetical protein VNM47_10030 [Terriglobia bacterium]|nr:hypothetical protein [Terriglobia bacterium]
MGRLNNRLQMARIFLCSPAMIRIRGGFILLAALGMCGYYLYDFLHLERAGSSRVITQQAQGNFKIDVRLTNLTYDTAAHLLRATVQLEVKATQHPLEIESVVLNLQKNPDGSYDWLPFEKTDLETFETVDNPKAPHLSFAQARLNDLTLLSEPGRREIWYPFDASRVELVPRACVNLGAESCANATTAQIKSVTLDCNDPGFVLSGPEISGNKITFRMVRRPFVHFTSIVFLVVAILFFVFLLVPPGRNPPADVNNLLARSLGFIGALWGIRALIVPSTVTIFPTVVDFSILTLFGFVFALIIYRVNKLYSKEGGL